MPLFLCRAGGFVGRFNENVYLHNVWLCGVITDRCNNIIQLRNINY